VGNIGPPQDDNGNRVIGAMIKKRAKRTGKAAVKKSSKKKNLPKKSKELHPAEVRKEVSQMVELQATEIAKAVIDRGKTGELATVKYLFEMSGVFPASTETTEGSPREDSLAETLLHRLNIPIEPIKHEEDDEPVDLGGSTAAKTDDEDGDEKDEAADGGEDSSKVSASSDRGAERKESGESVGDQKA
jgi:hypothetical protein